MTTFENLRMGPMILIVPGSNEVKDVVEAALEKGYIPFCKESIRNHPEIRKDFPDATHVIHTIFYEEIESV